MEPPRQVSRRGPGSGPVFRTFKKQPTSSFSIGRSSTVPTSLPSFHINSLPSHTAAMLPIQLRAAEIPAPEPICIETAAIPLPPVLKRHRTAPPIQKIVNTRDISRFVIKKKRKGPSRVLEIEPILDPRTRGNRGIRTSGSHKIDDDSLWASTAVAAVALDRIASQEVLDRRIAIRVKKNKQLQNKRQLQRHRRISTASEKVSENPTLDKLWASAEEDWKEPTQEGFDLLNSLKSENLPGCVQFIQHDYESSSGNPTQINRKSSSDVIGWDAVRSGRCLPPACLLSSGRNPPLLDIEPNELLSILAQAGGVDEGVWQQLQLLHDLQMDGHSFLCPPATTTGTCSSASSGCRDKDRDSAAFSSCSSEMDILTAIDAPSPSARLCPQAVDAAALEGSCMDEEAPEDTPSLSTALSDIDHATYPQSVDKCRKKKRSALDSMNVAVREADLRIVKRLPHHLQRRNDDLTSALTGPQSGWGRGTEGKTDTAAAAAVDSVVSLGKRGIWYADVWDEDDFVYKTNQGSVFPAAAMDDWSLLLHSYSDTHDGTYREWNVHHTRTIAAATKREQKKAPRRSQSPSCAEGRQEEGRISFLSPPVPVALMHPSCWGFGARKVAENTYADMQQRNSACGVDVTGGRNPGVFELIHPGSLSGCLVELPGTASVRDGLGDIDDFSLHAETLVRELNAVEASNYLLLQSLSSSCRVACQLTAVRHKRALLTDTLTLMYQRSEYEYESADRVTYANLPTPPYDPAPLIGTATTLIPPGPAAPPLPPPQSELEPATPAQQTRYGTRCASSASAAASATCSVREVRIRHQLGACLKQHVPHGQYVSDLKKGDPVELFQGGSWRAGRVLGLRLDGHLLRLLKIGPLGGAAGDHVWAAVEDGRVAPPGTHLHPALFRWMYPTLDFAQPRQPAEGESGEGGTDACQVAGGNITLPPTTESSLVGRSKIAKQRALKAPAKKKKKKRTKAISLMLSISLAAKGAPVCSNSDPDEGVAVCGAECAAPGMPCVVHTLQGGINAAAASAFPLRALYSIQDPLSDPTSAAQDRTSEPAEHTIEALKCPHIDVGVEAETVEDSQVNNSAGIVFRFSVTVPAEPATEAVAVPPLPAPSVSFDSVTLDVPSDTFTCTTDRNYDHGDVPAAAAQPSLHLSAAATTAGAAINSPPEVDITPQPMLSEHSAVDIVVAIPIEATATAAAAAVGFAPLSVEDAVSTQDPSSSTTPLWLAIQDYSDDNESSQLSPSPAVGRADPSTRSPIRVPLLSLTQTHTALQPLSLDPSQREVLDDSGSGNTTSADCTETQAIYADHCDIDEVMSDGKVVYHWSIESSEPNDSESQRRHRRVHRECAEDSAGHSRGRSSGRSTESSDMKRRDRDKRRSGGSHDCDSRSPEKTKTRRRDSWGKERSPGDTTTDHSSSRSRSEEGRSDRGRRDGSRDRSTDQCPEYWTDEYDCKYWHREGARSTVRGGAVKGGGDRFRETSSDRGRSRDDERDGAEGRAPDRDRKHWSARAYYNH